MAFLYVFPFLISISLKPPFGWPMARNGDKKTAAAPFGEAAPVWNVVGAEVLEWGRIRLRNPGFWVRGPRRGVVSWP